MNEPIYDPKKTYEENFEKGPFGAFADPEIFENQGEPEAKLLGQTVYLPFGISAGPVPNSNYAKPAFLMGFDVNVYKTVRTRVHPSNPWPNVIPVKAKEVRPGDEPLEADDEYGEGVSVTNSFGIPSYNPDFWQDDMKKANSLAGKGQFLIGAFQGTVGVPGGEQGYIDDFALAAKLVKETGVPVLEVNLSCPNEGSEELLCFDLERAQNVVEAIKNEIGNTPLVIKVAYFHDQTAFEKLMSMVGGMIEGVAAINTIPKRIVNEKGEQALPGKGREVSGVGGAGIKWAGVEMVERLDKIRKENGYKYEIIGIGGVAKPADYLEYRQAGAEGVMAATSVMWNPYLAKEIKEEIRHES